MPRSRRSANLTERQVGRLAVQVGKHLRASGLTLAAAESCTGGWIAKICTDIPGSSEWFCAGVVSYSNEAKTRLLGVPPQIIRRFGAVSEQTALAMARGALRRLQSNVAVAVTGIAGPGGGSPTKPVGTVWLSWAKRSGSRVSVIAAVHQFKGGRKQIRLQAVTVALQELLRN